MKKYIVLMLTVFVAPTFAWADAYTLTVEGLVCDFCAQGIHKKLTKEFKDQKIQNIHVDLNAKTVTFDADPIDQEKLGKLITSAGYNLKSVDVKPVPTAAPEMKSTSTPVPTETKEKK